MADNRRMILNLFSGMQDALFLGDRFAQGEFVSFLQPGQFVSTDLKENGDSDDMWIQSNIANTLIDSTYVNKFQDVEYSGGTELMGSVDQVYYDVLNSAALPYKPLSPGTIAELKVLTEWLSANQANYELYRDRYLDAVEAYDAEAASQNPSPGRLERLRLKKNDAYKNWDVYGQRQMYENKVGRYNSLIPEDPSAFWNRLRDLYRNQQKNAPKLGPYLQTFLVPSIASWASASWATFERQISEKDSYTHSKATSWSGGVSGRWGLWSAGGGASGSSKYERSESSVSTVSLKFQYLRVRVARPWMREDVFAYRHWTWREAADHRLISDGGNLAVTPPVRPIGRMPVFPRYLIVVRNVELSAAFSHEERTFWETQTQKKASVGWGPFSASGTRKQTSTTEYVKASFDGVTFRISEPQIIARTGLLMGPTPNPDKRLPWLDDVWFPDDARAEEMRYLTQVRVRDYANALEEELLLQARTDADEVADAIYKQRTVGLGERVREALDAIGKRTEHADGDGTADGGREQRPGSLRQRVSDLASAHDEPPVTADE
jgi:hypothetical protein